MRRPGRLSLERLAPYLLELPQFDDAAGTAPINWQSVFGNERPVEIEVGSGKGLFLIAAGPAFPDVNFLGIELVRGLQLYVATRLAKRDLRNVRVTCADACWLFRTAMPAASVRAVHVYFPDPWWKARHKKRRVFTPEFAADCERVLEIGGRLLIASDVDEYFQEMCALAAARPGMRLIQTEKQTGSPGPDEVLTNFERKARQNGGTVWRAVFERVNT